MKIHSMHDLRKARKLHYRTTFQGLPISIENRKGSIRHWTDRKGMAGKTKMLMPYGYVRGCIGADGDQLDVFLGPNKLSRSVWVVNQRQAHIDARKFDEHKVLLGFDSKEDAKDAYLKHYDKPQFLGSMTEMTIERFKQWISDGKKKTKPVYKSGTLIVVDDTLRGDWTAALKKGGPYIGPRGGKWADAQHTIPWRESGPKDVELARRPNGVLVVHTAGGSLRAVQRKGAIEVVDVELSEKQRGKGLGVRLYEKLISHAAEQKLPIHSDVTVEAPAMRVWESLKRRGHAVQVHPKARKSSTEGDVDVWFVGAMTEPVVTLDPGKLRKAAGLFIGPRGGKWADAKHTIPWREHIGRKGPRTGAIDVPDKVVRDGVEDLTLMLDTNRQGVIVNLTGIGPEDGVKVEFRDPTGRKVSIPLVLHVQNDSQDPRGMTGAIHTYQERQGGPLQQTVAINVSRRHWEKGDIDDFKKLARTILSHELAHAADPGLFKEQRRRARDVARGKTPKKGSVVEHSSLEAQHRAYLNQPHEVTATIQQVKRDITDANVAGEIKKDPEWMRPELLLNYSERWGDVGEHFTEKNQRRVLRAIFDMRESLLEGTTKEIKKSWCTIPLSEYVRRHRA